MTRMTFLFIAFVLMATALPGHAAVYKWTDPDGKVHYGHAPPPGMTSEKLSPGHPGTPAPPPPDMPSDTASGEAGATTTAPPEESSDAPRSKDGKDAEYCARAQENLKLLLSGQRLRIKQGDEYHFITDEERARHLDETQKQIQRFCK